MLQASHVQAADQAQPFECEVFVDGRDFLHACRDQIRVAAGRDGLEFSHAERRADLRENLGRLEASIELNAGAVRACELDWRSAVQRAAVAAEVRAEVVLMADCVYLADDQLFAALAATVQTLLAPDLVICYKERMAAAEAQFFARLTNFERVGAEAVDEQYSVLHYQRRRS